MWTTALAAILVVGVLLSGLFAVRILPWKQPDESAHFLYFKYLATAHRFPVLKSKAESSLYEAHQPPLYYLISLPVYAAFRGAGDIPAMYALRLWTGLFGVGTLWFVWWLAQGLFPRRPVLCLSATAFVALLPMHLYIVSSVGNDALAGMICAATVAVLVRSLTKPVTPRLALGLGVLVGLGLLSKTTCLFLAPLVAVRFAWASPRERVSAGQWLKHTGIAVLAAAVVAGWWLTRNQMLYGDPFAVGRFNQVFIDAPHPAHLLNKGLSLAGYVRFVMELVFLTFWGLLGEVNDAVHRLALLELGNLQTDGLLCLGLGLVFIAATALGALGARSVWPENPRGEATKRGLVLVLLGTTLVVLSFIQFNVTYIQVQARYLQPAVWGFALFFAAGPERLPTAGSRWAARFLLAAAMLVTGLLDVTVWR